MLRSALATLIYLCMLYTPAASANDALQKPSDIPVEAFAALPLDKVKLSPSGKKLAYLTPKGGRYHLLIQNIDGTNPLIIPPDDRVEFYDVHWKTDDIILFELTATLNRTWYIRRGIETRLASFDLKEEKSLWLGRNNNVKGSYGAAGIVSFSERIVDLLPHDPHHILMEYRKNSSGPVVSKVNVTSGAKTAVKEAATGITEWSADSHHDVRLGWGLYYDKKLSVRYQLSSGDWRYFQDEPWAEDFDVLYPAIEDDTLYVLGPTKYGTKGIFKMRLPNGDHGQPIFEHPLYDVEGLLLSPDGANTVVGYTYTDTYKRDEYFDETLALLQRSIDKAFPRAVNKIIHKSLNSNRYILRTSSDTNSGDYYLYDRATKKLSYLLSAYPHIPEKFMAQTTSVSIPVKSGKQIAGYLTSPSGTNMPLSTVIIPRSYIYGRKADASWNYIVQYLASRGLQVLQPNTVGSYGYGIQHRKAGVEQRDQLMQQNLTDSAEWLIESGKTPEGSICIMGTYYGGYAAIYGTIKDAGLFSCAVSLDGHLDITAGWRRDRYYIGSTDFINSISATIDQKLISPLHLAKKIETPILLMATRENSLVEYTQSKALHAKLKRLKKSHKYVQIEDTDQMLLSERARMIVLTETEKFLAKHIGN